ncbi:MAG: IclR family transcriptional regulator [Methylobacteriaceae bacterium]|nr:IclR family transcriptional regulator [Methylobacteriaceae bacterium]
MALDAPGMPAPPVDGFVTQKTTPSRSCFRKQRRLWNPFDISSTVYGITNVINSIVKAAQILDLFRSNKSLSLKRIAELCGLHKTTAHSIVLTLLAQRYLSQSAATREYSLGPALFELGEIYRTNIDAYGICLPIMRQLSQKLNRTVQLSMLSGENVVYLARVVTGDFLDFSVSDGVLVYAHCTASGKSMLSLLDDADFDKLYPEEALPFRTNNSIRSKSKLKQELENVRANGYAVDNQEAEAGLWGVGVSFKAAKLMAVSVSFTSRTVETADMAHIIEQLRFTRDEIVEKIGSF